MSQELRIFEIDFLQRVVAEICKRAESLKVNDQTEMIRRERLAEINVKPASREALEATYGQVWDTDQMTDDFEVIGFMAPLIVVRRKSDGVKGSLEFQHSPRFYFNWQPHNK